MWIGTRFLGRVEVCDGESIQTKFLVIGFPILPLDSYYVLARHARGIRGFELRTHARSVLAAYLRWYGWGLGLGLGVAAMSVPARREGVSAECAVGSVACIVVASIATFRLGRLSAREKERRRLMRRIAGSGVPVEFLPDETRCETRRRLQVAWEQLHGDVPWEDAIASGAGDPLLLALATYDLRPTLAEQVERRLGPGGFCAELRLS